MSTYYKRNKPEIEIENGVLIVDIPWRPIPSDNITIRLSTLIWAEEQGVTVVYARSKEQEYRATMEHIKYEGYEYAGFWFLPLWKWHCVTGCNPKRQKKNLKGAIKEVRRKYGTGSIQKLSELRGGEA